MIGLEKILIERLREAEKVVILGTGSASDADAAAGLLIAANLKKRFNESHCQDIKILISETTPENYAGEIKQFKPDQLLIIDTADALQEPGSITVMQPDIITGVSYLSHILPVRILVEYIKKETRCGITILGIQPADVTPGRAVTEKVRQSIDVVTGIIENVVTVLGLAQ